MITGFARSEPAATNVLALLGFNLIMFALVELPPIGFVLTPDRTRPLTKKLNGSIPDHRRILILIVGGAGGAYPSPRGWPTSAECWFHATERPHRLVGAIRGLERGGTVLIRPVRVVSLPPSGRVVASASVVSWNQACRPAPS